MPVFQTQLDVPAYARRAALCAGMFVVVLAAGLCALLPAAYAQSQYTLNAHPAGAPNQAAPVQTFPVKSGQVSTGQFQDASAQDAPAALPAPDAMAAEPDPSEFVTRSDGQLMVQGSPKRFGGMNASWLGLVQDGHAAPNWPTQFEIKDLLQTIELMAAGYTRAVSLGASAGCAECLAPSRDALVKPGGLNQDALKHLDQVLRQARDAGVKVIIPLSGGHMACPASGAPDPVADFACVFASWHHLDGPAFYTDPAVRADFAAYVGQILNHLNPLTGIAYKNDSTIMAWENCDGCGAGADPKMLADWTEFVGRTIKMTDSRHMYENGAFAGRLGKGADAVPTGALTLPSVDIIGDRVMPGIDADASSMDVAADRVTNANRVYLIDAYGWTPAQWPDQAGFQAFLTRITKNRSIAGAFVSELGAHADQGGYLKPSPAGPGGPALYFPGVSTQAADEATMQARARAVRRLSFSMQDILPLPFANIDAPTILSAVHGRIVWQGSAGATTYSIARSRDITAGGSWSEVCDRCVTDASPVWQDPAPLPAPVWYRMSPHNANDHTGMYSQPVQDK
jgi:mannan endo-1,4-beta-mannosidase